MVTLTDIFLSFLDDNENSRLDFWVNFSNGVTVPVVFNSEGWSTKAVINFVVLGGIVRASPMRTIWSFALILEVVMTWIVRYGNCMRPCVVSMSTLSFLIKCNPMIGLVSFVITTICSAKVLSPKSN